MTIAGGIFVAAICAVFAFLFWEEFIVPIREQKAIATEARRAETPKSGSVHEGAGPEGIAQGTSS